MHLDGEVNGQARQEQIRDAETRTLGTLWDGKQDACDERLAIVRLLEDGNLLAQTRAGKRASKLCVSELCVN